MDKKILRAVGLLGALVTLLGGCELRGGDGKSAVDEAQFIVEFVSVEQTAEGEARAGLTALPRRKTRIVIDMDGQSEPILRADIRTGSCDMVTGSPVYLLNDLKQGESETVVDVPLQELRGGPGYIIMIRRLNERTDFNGLCGNLFTAEENQ